VTCRPGYFIEVVAEWPPDPHDEARHFAVSLHLGMRRRPGTRSFTRVPGDPLLLQCADSILRKVVGQAFAASYILRVDVARAVAAQAPWPRWCTSSDQVNGLLGSLLADVAEPEHMNVYPISFWFIPRGSPDAERGIELFRKLPHDPSIFDTVLLSGVLRLAIFDTSCDLLAAPERGDQVLEWFRLAVEASPQTEVEWRVGPDDDASAISSDGV
jgi:hypothetical protein